jgi:hypothetical protein
MRVGAVLASVAGEVGAVSQIIAGRTLLGAVLGVVVVLVGLLVWDVRNKKGIAKWFGTFVTLSNEVSDHRVKLAENRRERKMIALEGDEERRAFRRGHSLLARLWPNGPWRSN